MGHERVGLLPKTARWRTIVQMIAESTGAESRAAEIADKTLTNVRQQFTAAEVDGAMEAAFTFLVDMSSAARSPDNPREFFSLLPANTTAATPLKVARALREVTAASDTSAEMRVIADSAAADAIGTWFGQHKAQESMFRDDEHVHFEVWHEASSAAGFCELSRLYFSSYVERYLNYFLEREASAVLPSLDARERFRSQMQARVEDVSRHAFETAKITQSFAAGWYQNHVVNGAPNKAAVRGFLSHVFGKLRSELMREGDSR